MTAAFVAHAREVLARATPGPWDVWPSVEAISEEPCLAVMTTVGGDVDMKTAAPLTQLAVNALPALLDVVGALSVFRKANDEAWQTLSEGPGGTAVEAAAEAFLAESEFALDAALARLPEAPK